MEKIDFEKYGGRKFIGFIFIAILLFVLTVMSMITPDQFVNWITANFGLYVAGNVGTSIANK